MFVCPRVDSPPPSGGFGSSIHLDQDTTPFEDVVLPFSLEGIGPAPRLPKVVEGDTLFDRLCTYNAPPWKLVLHKEVIGPSF